MLKRLSKILYLFFLIMLLSGCVPSKTDSSQLDSSNAIVTTSPSSISLEIDTKAMNSGNPVQTVTLTNIGKQPATHLVIESIFEDGIPLALTQNTCDMDLAAGANCTVKIKLYTNHKLAASMPISRSTFMVYGYDNGAEKKVAKLPVGFKLEKWVASAFLTNTDINGHILYQVPENFQLVRPGIDSADLYCRVDKNNPKNGYDYRALIYDTTSRTPYLDWVLIGGQTYFSIMPDVYHQKIWQTSYEQGIATNLFSKVYNCIGINCLLNKGLSDKAAWVGLQLDNNYLNAKTCGQSGNSWKSATNEFYGNTFAIKSESSTGSIKALTVDSHCDMQRKIICVSQ